MLLPVQEDTGWLSWLIDWALTEMSHPEMYLHRVILFTSAIMDSLEKNPYDFWVDNDS